MDWWYIIKCDESNMLRYAVFSCLLMSSNVLYMSSHVLYMSYTSLLWYTLIPALLQYTVYPYMCTTVISNTYMYTHIPIIRIKCITNRYKYTCTTSIVPCTHIQLSHNLELALSQGYHVIHRCSCRFGSVLDTLGCSLQVTCWARIFTLHQ